MSGDGIVSNELASIAGDAVDGTLMTFGPDPRKNPNAKELVEKFRAAGFEPEAYTLYSYAAVQVVAERPPRPARNDPQKVAEAIKASGPWKTAIGDYRLRRQGRHHPPRLRHLRMEEGRRRQVHLLRRCKPSVQI